MEIREYYGFGKKNMKFEYPLHNYINKVISKNKNSFKKIMQESKNL